MLKYLVVCSICLFAAQTTAAQADLQDKVSVRVEVQVEIVRALSVLAEKGLRFGDVRAGTGRVFVPKESDQAGMFIVAGREGMPVTINFMGPHAGRLRNLDREGAMRVSTELYGSNENSAAVADPLQLGDTITLGEDGRYYFYLQAALEVDDESENPPGEYSGTFTLEVEYL